MDIPGLTTDENGMIVFCVVVSGISGAGDLKKVGRIGLKSVIYFEVLTTVALVIGLIMAFSTGIGQGANIHLEQLSSAGLNELADKGQHIRGTSQFLMDLIPNSGTLIGVAKRAGLMGKDGHMPKMGRALIADSTAAMAGSLLGTSTTTSYIESAAGVSAGLMGADWRTAPSPKYS